MSLSHFYLPAAAWPAPDEGAATELVLTGDEAKHCVQVQRHREGDAIVLLDGAGHRASGRISLAGKNEVRLTELSIEQLPRPTRELVLVQALTKGPAFELILEKAVELGATAILPVLAERSISRLDAADAAKKHAKWQRAVIEAAKQCRQPWLPRLSPPLPLAQAIESVAALAGVQGLTASLQPEAKSWRELRAEPARAAKGFAIAIGPEGDFTAAEYARLRDSGWLDWSLGSLTLRSETAALFSLSILGHEPSSLFL